MPPRAAKGDITSTKKKPAPTAAKKATQKKDLVQVPANTKRKRDDVNDENQDPDNVDAKRAKTTAEKKKTVPKAPLKPKAAPKAKAPPKKGTIINERPTEILKVFCFGQGDMGELGLGAEEDAQGLATPRPNPKLAPNTASVVQVAVGGMHAAALTKDGKVLTWGVNDHGTLGRETASGELNDDTGLNILEATPASVDISEFPSNIVITSIAAGDNCTYAVTDDGHVWGWGTYRQNEGLLGFTATVMNQKVPMRLPTLTRITTVVCGSNHTLALDTTGTVYSWGAGQKGQLGRRITERSIKVGLTPAKCVSRKDIVSISAGENHSFAITKTGDVFSWGINNFGQCGLEDNAGTEDSVINVATKIPILSNMDMKSIAAGVHHSIALTGSGQAFSWGRCDNFQIGVDLTSLPKDNIITDERDRPRIVMKPAVIPNVKARMVAAGSDTSFVVSEDGKVFSWGFGDSYRHGLGTDDDVSVARQMKGKAIAEEKVTWVGAGGQFGMLASKA